MKSPVHEIVEYNRDMFPRAIQLKYKLMYKSVYNFFRGSCHLFYNNLSSEHTLPPSPAVWICGDLHLENFGSYKGQNRLVYFDINDFDECVLAPASYEIIRILTSIFIAFKSLGIEDEKATRIARVFVNSYAKTLSEEKPSYIEPKIADGIVRDFLRAVEKRKQKQLLSKRTINKGSNRKFCINKKQLKLGKGERNDLIEHINKWIVNTSGRPYNYEVVDVVFRVAGIGSLGLKRYLFLLKSTNLKEKYLLLDMKESRKSAVKTHVKIRQPKWNDESHRIVSVQRRMQNVEPFLLNTTVYKGRSFVLQELQSSKDSINFHLIKNRYRDMCQVISDMAVLTASAQLRSTGRQGAVTADELIRFGKQQKWKAQLITMAEKQAERIKEQYNVFYHWYKTPEH